MCNKKVYKRFKKIHKFITDKDCKYTRYFNDTHYKYKTFKTKLGDRNVIAYKLDKTIAIVYNDYNDLPLFVLVIEPNGKIKILSSQIDEIAIFSAIYELECLIYNYKNEKKEEFLETIFQNYAPNTNFGIGFVGSVFRNVNKINE